MATAYNVTGLLAFLGYVFNMYMITQANEFDVGFVWQRLWTANEVVALITIEVLVLYIALVLMIYYRDWDHAVSSVIFAPFIGPGAAVSQALVRQERELARFFYDKKQKE